MPIPSQPPRLENVIGNQADVFTIPEETPEGTSALSYKSGWPAKSATALSAGGVPPQREYFNAVNKLLSQHAFFQQSGSLYQGNNQNNYLQGAHILGSNGKEYVAKQQNGPDTSAGVQDPVQDINGTYWTSAGSSVAAGGGGLETDENGQLYVAKLKTPRAIDGVNFDGSEPVTRFTQCSTAAGTTAKTVTVNNFTLVEGATIMVLFNNTNTASNPTLNVSNTGAHPIQWRKAGVSPSWLAANRLYALTYTGSAWQIQGDLTEACIQEGGGLSVDEDGKLFVDFDSMPTDKFEAMLKSIRVPIWLTANKSFYVNGSTGSDVLDDGRGESSSKPFKTIQACINYVTDNYNTSRYTCTINIASGDYTSDGAIVSLRNYSSAGGVIQIIGANSDTEENTILPGISLSSAVTYRIKNVTLKPSKGDNYIAAVYCNAGAVYLFNVVLDISNTVVANGSLYGIIADRQSTINIDSTESMDELNGIKIRVGNVTTRSLLSAQVGDIVFSADISIEGNATMTLASINSTDLGKVRRVLSARANPGRLPTFTASGTISGPRYRCIANGIVNTLNGGTEFFPGDTAGTTNTGGQYL